MSQMSRINSNKILVEVDVRFRKGGGMIPTALIWEDGRRYEIDRIIDVRPSYAAKAGGQGDRYTVRVGGKERQLFFEHSTDCYDPNIGCWFVERKG